MRRSRLVVAIALVLPASACPIGDLTSGNDAASPDVQTDVTIDAQSDVQPQPDAQPDAGLDAQPDVQLDAPVDCTNQTALIGVTNIGNLANDGISKGSLDLLRYKVSSPGVARCAWIYVDVGQQTSKAYFTVYDTSGDGGIPGKLLATATLIQPTNGSWNSAPLDTPITLTANELLWIGALPPSESLQVRDDSPASCTPPMMEENALSTPPATFSPSSASFPTCNIAMYLGP